MLLSEETLQNLSTLTHLAREKGFSAAQVLAEGNGETITGYLLITKRAHSDNIPLGETLEEAIHTLDGLLV